jgi:hypothetical protein
MIAFTVVPKKVALRGSTVLLIKDAIRRHGNEVG